ncbi:MAG: 6-carboxytetrahydropterin synthase QueD [Planctomycetes bacterium]|nr:6-carboxytetrahydropterin synthase QueD [Planctomycetota bacterium]
MYELVIKSEFSAAHHLRGYKGKCEKLHGHNYGVELYIRQNNLDKLGLAIDFTVLKKALDLVLAEYDHKYLNELKDFTKLNPTAENIALMIHRRIQKKLPKSNRIKVCIWESAKAGACYSDAM